MTPLTKPVTRRSDTPLDGFFGVDRNKRLVVTLRPGGLLELRPERTRRIERVHLQDVYRFAIQARANAAKMDRLRTRKAKLAEQRERRSIRAAERRMKARKVEQ